MAKVQTNSLLSKLKREVEIGIETVQKEFKPLSSDVLNWKASNEKWSIAECFEHLNIYARYYNRTMESCIIRGVANNSQSETLFQSGWLGRVSINSVHPNNRKKSKTLKRLNPIHSLVSDDVLDEYLQHQTKLLELLEQAQKVDLARIKVPIEFFKLLKMRLGDCLQFVVAHQQRHVLQAKEVKQTQITTSW